MKSWKHYLVKIAVKFEKSTILSNFLPNTLHTLTTEHRNFKAIFLEITFLKLVVVISREPTNRSISNFSYFTPVNKCLLSFEPKIRPITVKLSSLSLTRVLTFGEKVESFLLDAVIYSTFEFFKYISIQTIAVFTRNKNISDFLV